MTATSIFIVILIFFIADFFLERWLDYLNTIYWSNELPLELKGIYDAEKYAKSQDYEKVKHNFSKLISVISFLAMLIFLYYQGFAIVDKWAYSLSDNPIVIAILFFGVLGFVSDLLTLPFQIYSQFVIEEKFGFNKTTVRTFILDKLKSWLLAIIIGGGLLSLITWFYYSTGNYFWIIAWACLSLFTVFMNMFYSSLIVPLFNKQKPLEEGELKDAIYNFANNVGFKLENIFVIDGSKRSSKANAYFSGLGPKKRIVLYDTLIQNHSKEELVAVLAHEIGHYKLKHTIQGMIVSVIYSGILFFILSLFLGNPLLSQALGASKGSFHMGIVAFGLLYTPISLLLGLVMNLVSRKNEFQADRYAVKNNQGDALQNALIKLSVDNLSNLRPHPVYVFFYYSHPPLLMRLKQIKETDK
ncbi:MAG TPA: M48 family metallopeptidase [Bacteroidales bacterium]|nr:M48 family metallopeptidase [Bacteroidales bacterium]